MSNQKKVSILKPCKLNYKNFKKTEFGGFCSACNKEVIDFTKMNPDKIASLLNDNTRGICGRMTKYQLKQSYRAKEDYQKINYRSHLMALSLSFFLITPISSVKAESLLLPKRIKKLPYLEQTQDSKFRNHLSDLIEVTGIVIDEEKRPLPGVSVVLKGTNIGTSTDFDGTFQFPQKLKQGDVLQFSYLGYETKEHKITSQKAVKNLSIQFELSEVILMGEIIVEDVRMDVNKTKTFKSIFKKRK